ncbi:type II toxin-antitoxin system VapC family toxin [Brevundimonas sp.]|uniref:type II toxin-antitoxin system VapC family toxin n=1 Tax=Brevundimonas sp. TaxID=1871086 RepID=UPI00286A9499|nr:type II toxin-antitoxin system VapC family toxin [Brevundimonas sp.]
MIALDSSALIEVVAQQPRAERCSRILSDAELIISAATLTEALIVGSRKRVLAELEDILGALTLTVEEVDAEFAERAAAAYRRWGKGFHRADLNYGDSFSYALAEMYDCPLLYVGDDFARTDIRSALA